MGTMETHNLNELEYLVVGAVLANPTFYSRAAFLSEDAFNEKPCATIWKMIERANIEGRPADPGALMVHHTNELHPLGGLEYLQGLAGRGSVIETAFSEAVDKLNDAMQWRRIATVAVRLQAAATQQDKNPGAVLSGLVDIATKYMSGGRANSMSKSEAARKALDAAREPRKTVTTGITAMDLLMQGGIQQKRLYGIGGLYGRGKTILLGTISDNLNIQSVPHLFVSLETPPEDIEVRSAAQHLNINASSIHDQGDVDHARFLEKADRYLQAMPDNVRYEFSPGATMDEIHRSILQAKARHGIHGFIIDYWQLIRGRERGMNEEAHLREVADRLAAICRMEKLWGIVAAQIDERGRLKVSESLYHSAALFLSLIHI